MIDMRVGWQNEIDESEVEGRELHLGLPGTCRNRQESDFFRFQPESMSWLFHWRLRRKLIASESLDFDGIGFI